MSPAPATRRITPVEPAIETLESIVAANDSPTEVAACVLDAAAAAVGCRDGALLVSAGPNGQHDVLATTAPDLYPPGRLVRPFELPAGAHAVPLRCGGADFGRIVLLDVRSPGPEANRALARIATLAAPLRPLCENGALRQRLAEAEAIVEVGQVLTGMLAMDDVLSYVVYLAESLVRGECASIALRSPDGRSLVLKNSTGSLRSLEGQTIPADESLMGWVVRAGQPVVTPNISDDPRSYALPSRQGPGIVVPVTINGETLGSFLVARLEGEPAFTDEELTTLERMAAYAAIAIKNAQLYREQMDAASALRAQAEELQDAYSELNRQHEQLIIAEKMAALGRITAGIAHEINSPLAGIMNSLRTARGYVDEYSESAADPEITAEDHAAIATDISTALGLAETAVAKVAQFVRSIKAQTRPGEGERTTFDAAAEVDGTVLLLQHRLREEGVTVSLDLDPVQLTGDQGKFALLVQNLVGNAIDAYEGRPGEIRVRLRDRGDTVTLEVEDEGCGIPDEIRARIFDYLFTTKDVGKGTGLGLAMVHTVVTDFGGTIDLESEVGRGTTFRLSLPTARTDD